MNGLTARQFGDEAFRLARPRIEFVDTDIERPALKAQFELYRKVIEERGIKIQ